jgi:hypothetical protein
MPGPNAKACISLGGRRELRKKGKFNLLLKEKGGFKEDCRDLKWELEEIYNEHPSVGGLWILHGSFGMRLLRRHHVGGRRMKATDDGSDLVL